MKQAQNSQVRAAGAGELADADQHSQSKSGRQAGSIHQLSHSVMSAMRNTELNRELRYKNVQDVYETEGDQKSRSHFTHELRNAEEVKRLENA